MKVLRTLCLVAVAIVVMGLLSIVNCSKTEKRGKNRRDRKRCSKVCTQKFKEEYNKLKVKSYFCLFQNVLYLTVSLCLFYPLLHKGITQLYTSRHMSHMFQSQESQRKDAVIFSALG